MAVMRRPTSWLAQAADDRLDFWQFGHQVSLFIPLIYTEYTENTEGTEVCCWGAAVTRPTTSTPSSFMKREGLTY